MKKILKKETSIKKENIIIWPSLIKIEERLFVGRKPPDEIIVIAKLRELKILISIIFKINFSFFWTTPSCIPINAVRVLKGDPGGYSPCRTLSNKT